MMQIRKKEGKIIKAYCLGERHPVLDQLIGAGYLKQVDDNHWRVYSQESTKGEKASSGDFIKIDTSGFPYPNTRSFFMQNHRHMGGDDYLQIPKTLLAWRLEHGMCSEIRFLIEHKELKIHREHEQAFFSAPLWGDILSAPKNAVIVFYDITYGDDQEVVDANFNFVAEDEFYKTYDMIG